MEKITMYFDFISPYAYLAFKTHRNVLGDNVDVEYRPILFAGLLNHHGQLGPAEIDGKREWTFRQSLWEGRESGVCVQLPVSHPFNPLPFLRLAIASSESGKPSYDACEAIFDFVWNTGKDLTTEDSITEIHQVVKPVRDITDPDVKAQLRVDTERAIEEGVFGVPCFCHKEKVFWGKDSIKMLKAHIEGDSWFEKHWDAANEISVGIKRTKKKW